MHMSYAYVYVHVHVHVHVMCMCMHICMCMVVRWVGTMYTYLQRAHHPLICMHVHAQGAHHALVLEQALRRELLSRGGRPRRGNLMQVQGAMI